jgi:hypothetical protein
MILERLSAIGRSSDRIVLQSVIRFDGIEAALWFLVLPRFLAANRRPLRRKTV